VSPAKILTPGQKGEFAEYALQHAYEALDKLIHVMRHGESETAVITAAGKILDRALGKAPAHIDVTAPRHTEIVYRSVEEIREECIARGVPPILLEHMKFSDDSDSNSSNGSSDVAAG
jgi:hypothetical protein